MAMITSWTKKQQPSLILVALIGGFALLPAGSVAQPPNDDQTAATVLDQLRSGACRSSDSNSIHLCVDEFRSGRGGFCCLRLGKECLCAIQEKQAVLNIQGPNLCGSLTGDCTLRAEAAKAAQQQTEEQLRRLQAPRSR